jgi:hypothetical protein
MLTCAQNQKSKPSTKMVQKIGYEVQYRASGENTYPSEKSPVEPLSLTPNQNRFH